MRKKDKSQILDHRDCLGLSKTVRAHPSFQAIGREVRYRKGAYIWRPEDAADSLYWLQEGQVVELRGPSVSKSIIIRIIIPGEPFGHFCFCASKDGVRGTHARVNSDAVALRIKFVNVIATLQSDQTLLTQMLFQFCARLTDCERRLEILTYRGARKRLGRLLLDLGESRSTPSNGIDTVCVPITHDELARMTLMNRSHVTVTMGGFRRAGLVEYRRDQPLVINLTALRRYLSEIS